MRLCDLTKEQRTEVKQRVLCDRLLKGQNRTAGYSELADADELVSDKELEEAYGGTEFTLGDFSCGEAYDRDGVLDELKEWAERELTDSNFAKSKGVVGQIHLHEHIGLEWARQFLLEHIKAVRP